MLHLEALILASSLKKLLIVTVVLLAVLPWTWLDPYTGCLAVTAGSWQLSPECWLWNFVSSDLFRRVWSLNHLSNRCLFYWISVPPPPPTTFPATSLPHWQTVFLFLSSFSHPYKQSKNKHTMYISQVVLLLTWKQQTCTYSLYSQLL